MRRVNPRKHNLKVIGRAAAGSEEVVLFQCENCPKQMMVVVEVLKAILVDRDRTFAKANLVGWSKCR